MEIINKSVRDLVPYENNPRNNDEAVEYVAASIREFGFKVPIVIDRDGVIVAGHTRLKAALKLGLDEVPCIVADDLTPDQVAAFRLADNKVSEQATWNVDKLLEEIGKTEIDLSTFGFDLEELGDAILEETEEEQLERQKREFEERMAAGELSEDSEEYQEFLKKFEAKKTTDDCYTPAVVYDAIADYVAERYSVSRVNFVRPFFPGGDYEKHDYPAGCVVVDNPPFSILSKIVAFYEDKGIKFFLWAPGVSLFNAAKNCTAICTMLTMTYENGASIATSFLTNLEPDTVRLRSDPELYRRAKAANAEFEKGIHRELPKYAYPLELVTAAAVALYSKYGVEFSVSKAESYRVSALDQQKAVGKGIFGAGYLISEREKAEREKAEREKAEREKAEREKAEREKAEREKAERWELSDREWEIVRSLGKR